MRRSATGHWADGSLKAMLAGPNGDMLQPKFDFAMVMMTNRGGDKADAALRALGAALYKDYGPARAG